VQVQTELEHPAAVTVPRAAVLHVPEGLSTQSCLVGVSCSETDRPMIVNMNRVAAIG